MCQLLGISYSKPTPFNRLFAEFRKRGEHNPHAWGVAYWPSDGRGPAVVREARAAHESPLAAALASSQIPAVTVVAHVRFGTTAGEGSLRSTANAHPFLFRANGRDWAGAHNGYLRGVAPLERRPEGTTDSEAFFCRVADELEIAGPEEEARIVAELAGEYAGAGKLNFLLSDGERLFFFAGHPASAGGLYFLEAAHRGVRAVAVATKPLFTGEGWREAEPGRLYVARGGRVVESRAVRGAFRTVAWRAPGMPSGRHLSYIDYLEAALKEGRKAAVN